MAMSPSEEPEKYLIQRARDALACDPRVGELHIDVSLRGDRVFLTGVVPSAERRDVIADVVRGVLPGYQVQNHVTVEEFSGTPEVESLG